MQKHNAFHFCNLDNSSSMSHRGLLRLVSATLLLTFSGAALFSQQPSSTVPKSALAAEYGKLPLSFEENQGQVDPQVRFTSRGNGYSLSLTDTAAILSLSKIDPRETEFGPRRTGAKRPLSNPRPVDTDVVRMELVKSDNATRLSGVDELAGKVNYFIGNDPSKWRSNVPTYRKVKYSAVYPGVDLVYYGNQRQLEYDFVVAPRANANQVRLHFAGASKLMLNGQGDLTVAASNGELSFHKPVVYQMKNGNQELVSGSFKLSAKNEIGFVLGKYDVSRELVIDPVLAYSTYLGGTGGESITGIATDASGNAYVAGMTYSEDFPFTNGAMQTVDHNQFHNTSAFVAKLNSTGTQLLYSTYLGGSGAWDAGEGDAAEAIAVDSLGNAYVTGATCSPDFPVTNNAFQVESNGAPNGTCVAFVTKLNPAGNQLAYSTYLGGSGGGYYGSIQFPVGSSLRGGDMASAIAVDSSGHAYVAGATTSVDFPVTYNAFQKNNVESVFNQNAVAFVTKLNAAGTGLVYSTYLGGSGSPNSIGELAGGIAVDTAGDAFIAGTTSSGDFPVTNGAYQPNSHGAYNVFVTKLNPTGTAPIYSTYLGGGFEDYGNAIAIDASGNAYVTGSTNSFNFPVTGGAFQNINKAVGGSQNAFVSKLNPAGTELVYSTFLGGSGIINPNYDASESPAALGDIAYGIAVDKSGQAYVAGSTWSTDFPVTIGTAAQASNQSEGFENVFLTELNAAGSAQVYSTYLGGNYNINNGNIFETSGDGANAIALHSSPAGVVSIYLGGYTESLGFPVTWGAFQMANKSLTSATGFVSKFSFPLKTTTTLTSNANPQLEGKNVTFTAHVVPSPGNLNPTGSIMFVGNLGVSFVTLDGTGHASISSTSFPPGLDEIDAYYSGDLNNAGSIGTMGQTITGATKTSLSSSSLQSIPGKPVTFTAIVTGDGTKPTGSVKFQNGNTTLGTVTLSANLSGGIASLTTISLPLGTSRITAVYEGCPYYSQSTSPVVTEVVSSY